MQEYRKTGTLDWLSVQDGTVWKIWLMALTGTFLAVLWKFLAYATKHPAYMQNWKTWMLIVFAIGCMFILHGLTWLRAGSLAERWIFWLENKLKIAGYLNLIVFAGLALGFYLVLFSRGKYSDLISYWVKIFVFLVASGGAAFFLRQIKRRNLMEAWMISALGIGLGAWLIYQFPRSLNNPFSNFWSEGSWYYYASFFFSQKIYGTGMPWPFLDIGKPLLLSPVFALPDPSIAAMRLWNFTLEITLTGFTAWFLIRRLEISGWFHRIILLLAAYLWFMLGPVRIHLIVPVMIVLAGVKLKNYGRSLIVLAVASLWAGIMRFNWIPVPAMLAIAVYLMETVPVEGEKWYRYLRKPFWMGVVGVGCGIISQVGYIILSGRLDTRIVSKFSASFLWYRLLPNSNLPTGILPGILLVTLTALILAIFFLRKNQVHPLRWILIAIMLLILLAGGVIASVKIGGGDNLRNLDAYSSLLILVTFYILTGRFSTENPRPWLSYPAWSAPLFLMAAFFWLLQYIYPVASIDAAQMQVEIDALREITQSASAESRPVLFMWQRHILSFGDIEGVPLVTDYEEQEFLESLIVGDFSYQERFVHDLQTRRFGVVVVYHVEPVIQEEENNYREEWNLMIRYPLNALHTYYRSYAILPQSGIEIFVPK